MKGVLASPLTLTYNGEIYTFDELCNDTSKAAAIPAETLTEYLDYLEVVCDYNDVLAEMQDDISNVREAS